MLSWKPDEADDLKREQRDPFDAEYRGVHMQKYRTERDRFADWKNIIFLFNPQTKEDLDFIRLNQVVPVWKHTMSDFEFNAKKIINHYKMNYGDSSLSIFTIGQSIAFTVYPEQKEPFHLPLFRFFVNYVMLITPILCGADMRNWRPWVPRRWTASAWNEQIDKYIAAVRSNVNMRRICETIEMSKYLMNIWVDQVGDRLALSISNNEFIEVMNRDKLAHDIITCSFPVPDGISPTELEALRTKYTNYLLDFIGKQTDLSISTYTRNKLLKAMQAAEYFVHICHKPDLNGNTIPYTYSTNIMMGIADLRAFSVDAHGARKAEIIKLNVSEAGRFQRAMSMMCAAINRVDIQYECDSKHYRTRFISSQSDLYKIDGRVYKLDPDSDEYYIADPNNTSLIGKKIYMKTVITCTHPRRKEGIVCSACYGKLMSNLNCDVGIGRLAAVESSDEIEQKLLSGKHALSTDTMPIEFDDDFYRYFELGVNTITLNSDMIEASAEADSSMEDVLDYQEGDFQHLYLEFHPSTMKKCQDGESRHFDRSFQDIVIYDDRDDSRITITEKNGLTLYLSPEFNDTLFLPELRYKDANDTILIPFTDIAEGGGANVSVLFEFSYKNNELAQPLQKLESIMFNDNAINSFENYDECLNEIMPLFMKGGIHIPDYQTEMIIAQMVSSPTGELVDWNDPNPEYRFNSIVKSIRNSPSALLSVSYHESGQQIAGLYKTYDKTAPSDYDWFIYERSGKPVLNNKSPEQ